MNKSRVRVLIVEDDLVDRMACRRALAQDPDYEFVLSEAETGREGLQLAHAQKPDYVLLDYHLPDLNGLEFLAKLRNDQGEIPVPVMMLTGADNASVAVEAMKRGAQDYLVKDMNRQYLELLPAIIRRVLREQQTLIEKKRMEENLAKAEAKYRFDLRNKMEKLQKLQVASQTAAAVAHELNQPLLAISSYNETALMLMDSGKADFDRIRTAIEKSKQQAYRAGQSIREMLNCLNLGGFRPDEFDLNMEMRNIVEDIRKEGNVRFDTVYQLEEGLPLIRANLLHIKKAISNLLINSLEAVQEAGVHQPSITAIGCTKKDANVVQITIQDNGPGIKEEIRRKLFQPFHTSKSKGIGMGLAISRSLIEMNGGQLWLDTQEGPGATFHLTLPFAA